MDEVALRAFADGPGVGNTNRREGELVFAVGGRMFRILALRGPQRDHQASRVDGGQAPELIDRPGMRPAPCLARVRWVQVVEPDAAGSSSLRTRVRRSDEPVRPGVTKKPRRGFAD